MPRNRSERDSDKVRKIVTDTDGMFVLEVIENFRSVIDKRRETLANVRLLCIARLGKFVRLGGFTAVLMKIQDLKNMKPCLIFKTFETGTIPGY